MSKTMAKYVASLSSRILAASLFLFAVACVPDNESVQDRMMWYHLSKAADATFDVYRKGNNKEATISALKVFLAIIPAADDWFLQSTEGKEIHDWYIHYAITMHGRMAKTYDQLDLGKEAQAETEIAMQYVDGEKARTAKEGSIPKWLNEIKNKETLFHFIDTCDKIGLP